jgi:hypothetical protein
VFELCHQLIVTGPPPDWVLLSLLVSSLPVPQAASTVATAPIATARTTGVVLMGALLAVE